MQQNENSISTSVEKFFHLARKQELAAKPLSCSIRCPVNEYSQTFNGFIALNKSKESEATQIKTNFATIEKAIEGAQVNIEHFPKPSII